MPPPLVLPSSSTADGVSLRTYRRRLIPTLGRFAFGSVTTEASGLEAERYLISTNLRGDGRGRDFYDGLFCYVSEGPTQRRLVNGAYEGSRGAVTMDDVYDDPLPQGTLFELSVLPAEPWGGAEGLNPLINLALESLPVIVWENLTIVDGQSQYSFAGHAYPVKGIAAVAYARDDTTNEARREVPMGSWSYDQNGESPVLSFTSLPGSVGDVLEVGLIAPASTRVRQGGTWGSVSTGLTSDTDEALYDAQTVVNAARPLCLERLRYLYPMGSKERDAIERMTDEAWVTSAFSKFYGRFRSSGVQRAGASGSGRSWGKGWSG